MRWPGPASRAPREVRVSRAGTSSRAGAFGHTVHLVELEAPIRIRRRRYDGRPFA